MSLRNVVLRNLTAVLSCSAALFLAGAANAALVVQSVPINQSISSGGTNGAELQFFSVDTTFNQFDVALGVLNSATLSWNVTGHILVTSNMEGQAKLSFRSASVTKNADSDGSPPNDVDFVFNSSEALALAGLTGIGTVDLGDFVGSVREVAGFFPWSATLSALGSVSLTYDYTPDRDPPPPGVPEPATLALAGLTLLGLRRRVVRV